MPTPEVTALENKRLYDTDPQTGQQTSKDQEALNAQYPDEIEYYACALELIDGNGKTTDFFSFPVMPSNLRYGKPTITNIRKTYAGVVITDQPTFIPFDIQIGGNFGRMFRKITSPDNVATNPNAKNTTQNAANKGLSLSNVVIQKVFSSEYKTGYGNTKILESICDRSKLPDEFSQPQKLIFYDLSSNHHYMVEIINSDFSISKELNGIWVYAITMKAVAPASDVISNAGDRKKSLRSYAKKNMRMNDQSTAINGLLSKGDKNNKSPVQNKIDKIIKSTKNVINDINKNPIGRSAYQVLITNTQHSIENNEFMATIGKNRILHHIPTNTP